MEFAGASEEQISTFLEKYEAEHKEELDRAELACNPPILIDEEGNGIGYADGIKRDAAYWEMHRQEDALFDAAYEEEINGPTPESLFAQLREAGVTCEKCARYGSGCDFGLTTCCSDWKAK